jgi:hypothetical protein
MSLKPWMKWYPADWRSDPKLRMCCASARGVWADMLALMHEGEPYGHLLVNGMAPNPRQLASLIGTPEREVSAAVAELGTAGVYSKTNGGVIYSRRMVRDNRKAEQDRANGKGGGNPYLVGQDNGGVNPHSNQDDNGEDKAQKLEARSQKPERKSRARGALSAEQQVEFDAWWPHYPNKVGKAEAVRAFPDARVKATLEDLIAGAQRYAALLAKPNAPLPKHPQGWLNGERWKDEIGTTLNLIPAASTGNLTPDENDRLHRLERFIESNGERWYQHHGPEPTLKAARAEFTHLESKRAGKVVA